jgi:hypothetical protein
MKRRNFWATSAVALLAGLVLLAPLGAQAEEKFPKLTPELAPHSLSIFATFLILSFLGEGLLQRHHARRALPRPQGDAS